MRTSPHCMGILGLDRDERFAIAKSNWDYEERADGRRIDWGKTSYYRETIYMRTESHAGTIGNVLHYFTTKRYVVRGCGQGECTTTRARRRDGVWPRATLSVRLTVGTGEGDRDQMAMRSGQVARSYWAEVT